MATTKKEIEGKQSSATKEKIAVEKIQRKIALETLWRDVFKNEKKYLYVGWGSMIVSSLSNLAVPALIGTVLDITNPSSSPSFASPTSSSSYISTFFGTLRSILGNKVPLGLNNAPSATPSTTPSTTTNTTTTTATIVSQRDRPIEQKDFGRIWLVMIGVFFVGGSASFLRTHCLRMAKESTARRLRKKILAQMLASDQTEVDLLFTTQKARTEIDIDADVEKEADATTKREKEKELGKERGSEKAKGEIQEKKEDQKIEDDSELQRTTKQTILQVKNIRDVISILNQDVEVASEIFTTKLADFLRSCNSTINGSIFLISLSPSLCLVSLSLVPLIGTSLMLQSIATKKIQNDLQEAESDCCSFAIEKLSHLKTVKSFGQESKEVQRYSDLLGKTANLSTKVSLRKGAFMGGLFFTSSTAVMAVVYFGGYLAGAGKLTVGNLISFGAYTGLVGLGSSGISGYLSDMYKGKGGMAVTRVHQLQFPASSTTTTSAKNKGNEEDIDSSKRINFDSLDFQNITFSYPHRQDMVINYPSSISVNKGDIVAIVGASGRGKSTLGSLLLGLYKPSSGTISLNKDTDSEVEFVFGGGNDGIERGGSKKNLDLETFYSKMRQEIGLVEQEPVLFSGTIAENIAYSDESIVNSTDTNDRNIRKTIEDAATIANAHGFISQLPLGYDTYLGVTDTKSELSGGQKQRIAIARAVFKNPSIFFFDEATSSLDSENAHEVNEALLHIIRSSGKTVIVIAHDSDNPLIQKATKKINLDN